MKTDSTLQKLEVHVVTAVAVVVVLGIAFVASAPFSAPDYGVSDVATTDKKSPTDSSISQETRPALLEPALRSLDGVTYHG
ncbi:MAG TPA: hypothetical protein VE421_07640 [Burkholderiaceae bacterium]|jgi:biopolymer transport protein ExbD|nr:hypothetical protein [Burkholderiaceae bacterium]